MTHAGGAGFCVEWNSPAYNLGGARISVGTPPSPCRPYGIHPAQSTLRLGEATRAQEDLQRLRLTQRRLAVSDPEDPVSRSLWSLGRAELAAEIQALAERNEFLKGRRQ